jgi:hypothetical protein
MTDQHAKGETFKSVSAGFLDGFHRVPRPRQTRIMNPAQQRAQAVHESRVASAAEFLSDLLTGAVPYYYLQESLRPSSPEMVRVIEANYPGLHRRMSARETAVAEAYVGDLSESMTTSDFPLLMGDVLDRMMLQRFAEVPQVWRQYISVGRPLRDFRNTRLIATDGGDGAWSEITEEDGLTYTNITETGYTISPALYGKAVRLSWRLLVNDDLDAFAEVPAVLGRGGRRTISRFATDLLFDSNGPDATFFSAGNGNLISGNPDLDVTSLGLAIQQFAGFLDSEGEPIVLEGIRLVHGPGLRITAKNILNQLTVDITEGGGTTARVVRVNNWLVSGLTAVEDPYIPIIATSNGDTSWLLTTDPNTARPAARVRFLQGFENPNLYQKAPNTQRIGGGLDDAVGDWQSMAQEYKGMVCFGGSVIEPKAAVGSNGSG